MPKAILFDLDNTLIWDERSNQESFEATCRYAGLRVNVDPGHLESCVRDESLSLYRSLDTFPYANAIEVTHLEALWARFDQGDHPMLRRLEKLAPSYRKQAWTRGLLRAGVNDEALGGELAELFMQERRNRPIVYEDTFQALDQLKGDYSLLLLTNGAPDLQQEKVDGIPGLSGYFPHIVISGYLGEGKPGESIFNHCMRLLDAGPSECVMIGDNLYTDILGANRSGISSIWLNRTGRQRERDIGIIPTYEAAGLLEIPQILRNASLL
ncbi:HAD family hydrolase [Paenibacillus sp. sptzw28]|uniref:HAD family hydrolase n=1 Tax=Paenibacillus sp. sptzw28 TaxID=715179 RepID=UPI001C6F1973|nr:HAD family hydrolase [Paenibacillus sp. sptzw28]QYR22525.1 HAD family hydrolase [Paenibacillus sp. sptzw28]